MNSDRRIESDLKALADETGRGLPSLDTTARAVSTAMARRAQGDSMRTIRRFAVAAALVAAVLLCPVPQSRVVGYDLTVQGKDGKTAVTRLSTRDAIQAERSARFLRARGAQVTVAARTERAWSNLYAMAREALFSIDVETQGKTDEQVEAEIRSQLAEAGWTASDVAVERDATSVRTEVGADDGSGRVIRLVQKKEGGDTRVQMAPPQIDDTREPGMTDEQLRDKIVRQLQALGMDADVTVEGDKVQIRATRHQ